MDIVGAFLDAFGLLFVAPCIFVDGSGVFVDAVGLLVEAFDVRLYIDDVLVDITDFHIDAVCVSVDIVGFLVEIPFGVLVDHAWPVSLHAILLSIFTTSLLSENYLIANLFCLSVCQG